MNIKIYQLKSNKYMFCSFNMIKNLGHELSINDYKLMYEYDIEDTEVTTELLDDIYRKFNVNRPEDFHGHSLSVSDVIVIDDTENYFVDRTGFTKILIQNFNIISMEHILKNVGIKKTCPLCGKTTHIAVNGDDYEKWQNGTLIQRAFPYMSAEEREVLITGLCYDCQAKVF